MTKPQSPPFLPPRLTPFSADRPHRADGGHHARPRGRGLPRRDAGQPGWQLDHVLVRAAHWVEENRPWEHCACGGRARHGDQRVPGGWRAPAHRHAGGLSSMCVTQRCSSDRPFDWFFLLHTLSTAPILNAQCNILLCHTLSKNGMNNEKGRILNR